MKPTYPCLFLALAVAGALPAQGGETQESPPTPKAEGRTQDPAEEKPLVLEVGATVPGTVGLRDTAGQPFTFEDVRGKTVVIHFWSIVCPAEKAAEPKLLKLADDYREKDVVVLAIAANAREIGEEPAPEAFEAEKPEDRPYADLRAKAEAVEFNHRILVDHGGRIARLFAARTTPHCFVVDPNGVLVYSGALDDDQRGRGDAKNPYVQNAVEAVLAERAVEPSTTRPYG